MQEDEWKRGRVGKRARPGHVKPNAAVPDKPDEECVEMVLLVMCNAMELGMERNRPALERHIANEGEVSEE